jgi:hypothetical protein
MTESQRIDITERRPGTVQRFNAAEEWSRLATSTFRLRAPAASTEGLAGPYHGVGTCLAPVLLDGDLGWYDSTLEPVDGDFVLVRWSPERLREIVDRNRHKPEWVQMYGEDPPDIAGKWLRTFAREFWTVCNESMMPLSARSWAPGTTEILGVLRYVIRNGKPIGGSGEVPATSHFIAPNAATATYSVFDAGPINVNNIA